VAKHALWALVLLAWVTVAIAQAPINAEQAVRYQAQTKAAASAETVDVASGPLESSTAPALDLNIDQQRSSAQLHELGSIYAFSKDNAVQLHELGSIYAFSKDNAVQLHELGSIYAFSKD